MNYKGTGMKFHKFKDEKIDKNILLNHSIKLKYVEAINLYGGSFYRTIAEAMIKADAQNLGILVSGFGQHIVDEYTKYVEVEK